jgi:hypothetical protein
MSGPWEQYQQQSGPWTQYQGQPVDETQLGSNIINTDVPTVVSQTPRQAPMPQQRRTVGDYAKAFLEVPATIGSAAVAPFIGVGAGIAENIRQGTNQRVDRPELAQRFTYQPTSPVSQDVVENLGGALESAKIPAYVPSTGQLARGTMQSAQTIPSYARAMGQEIATEAAPLVRNVVENPIVQKGVETVQKGVETVKQKFTPEPKKYTPSEQALSNIADSAFQRAKKEGVEIDTAKFVTEAQELIGDLRTLGYDPRLHPSVAVAIETLTDPKMPKDLAELKTIRTFIKDAQGSENKAERQIATVLKQRFDEYMATMPKENLTGGSKEGLRAWREGQMAYSRLGKSQIFTDMLERAEFDAQTIGVEKSLTNQIIALAKNEKRKRLFTKSEQEMIEEAAKGGNTQNFLRYMAKYSPSSPIASTMSGAVGAGVGTLLSSSPEAAMIGATVIPAIGGAARMGATKMRKTQIEKLADAMRTNPNAGLEVDFSKAAGNPITNNDRIAEILRRFNQGE